MARKEVSDSAASRMLADFFNRHLARGTGNAGVPQKAAAFANRSTLPASSISEWRNRTGGLPGVYTVELIERTFFPDRATRANDPAFREWQEVRRAIANHGLPVGPTFEQKRFNLREAWDLLLRPLAEHTLPIVRSAVGREGASVLHREQISARTTGGTFILPMPMWFEDAIRNDRNLSDRYDIHEPIDLSGSETLDGFYDAVPIAEFRTIVAYHADAHARQVLETLRSRSAYPPFNKKKVGLAGYRQTQRSARDEGVYLDLDLFVTDYHTHRVMKRVLHDVRSSHPRIFGGDSITDGAEHLPYFMTSFGLNVLATTQEQRGKRFYMVRLSNRQGNANQQGLWHISANEGVSCEDVRDGAVDIGSVVARALAEEWGADYTEPVDETVYLQFAIDQRNLEPFISCVAHLGIDRDTLYRRKQHVARDDRREFSEVRDFPFSEKAIIGLLIGEPAGSNGFTSYSLGILDSILVRGLAPNVID